MRYPKHQKEASKQRIVEVAGSLFKQNGIDATGIATVMSEAGLTNGAFYGHFESKEDLVASVLIDQLRKQRETFASAPAGRAGLEAIIREYLSPGHLEQWVDGCPSAALLDEIGRRTDNTRQAFTDTLLGIADDIASRIDPAAAGSQAARIRALALFGLMIGTLQLARALTDRKLSEQLLAQGIETALSLLDRPVDDRGAKRN